MKAWLTRDAETHGGHYAVFGKVAPVREGGTWTGHGKCRCLLVDVNPADFNLAPLGYGECVAVTIQIQRAMP